ncbi:flagellar hook-length control protein FliK [Demequina aestuarii]|uniref:flagellar hook-length control protein FliK n=1 Tax=Demequina aestuarii TaxID=327095 RepID=UPI0007857D62|nr:flagellar hook-length control protein FliK [Demequina aestuarii]
MTVTEALLSPPPRSRAAEGRAAGGRDFDRHLETAQQSDSGEAVGGKDRAERRSADRRDRAPRHEDADRAASSTPTVHDAKAPEAQAADVPVSATAPGEATSEETAALAIELAGADQAAAESADGDLVGGGAARAGAETGTTATAATLMAASTSADDSTAPAANGRGQAGAASSASAASLVALGGDTTESGSGMPGNSTSPAAATSADTASSGGTVPSDTTVTTDVTVPAAAPRPAPGAAAAVPATAVDAAAIPAAGAASIAQAAPTSGAAAAGTSRTDGVAVEGAGTTAQALPNSAPAAVPSSAAPAAATAPSHPPLAPQLAPQFAQIRHLPQGEHVLTVTVDPEHFGPVKVVVHITADGASVQLLSSTEAGREALRGALADLRRDLAATGMNADLDLGPGQDEQAGREEAQSEREAARLAVMPTGTAPALVGPAGSSVTTAGSSGSQGVDLYL